MAEASHTVELERGLQKNSPQANLMLDFKLGFLDRLDHCLNGRIHSKGTVSVWLHFDVKDDQGIGSEFELIDSELSPEEDRVLLDCGRRSLVGRGMKLDPAPADPKYHWSSVLTFPLDDDVAYRFIRTGHR